MNCSNCKHFKANFKYRKFFCDLTKEIVDLRDSCDKHEPKEVKNPYEAE
jgi:hypothetical protein